MNQVGRRADFFSEWSPCAASESDAEVSVENGIAEEQPVGEIVTRPFSIAEQPVICRTRKAGGSSEGAVTTLSSQQEAFGVELSVAYAPDGRFLVSGSDMGLIKIWRESAPETIQILRGHYTGWPSPIAVSASPDGRRIISGGEDGLVKIWHLVNAEAMILSGFDKVVHAVAFRPSGQGVTFGLADGSIWFWNWGSAAEAQKFYVLREHRKWVYAEQFTADGRRLASGGGDGFIRVREAPTRSGGTRTAALNLGRVEDIYSLSFSRDGRFLAFGAADGSIGIWDMEASKVRVLQADSNSIRCVAFSPMDGTLAFGMFDGRIGVWDWRSGRMRMLNGHKATVWSLAFSADGRRLVSGGGDETIRIWHLAEAAG